MWTPSALFPAPSEITGTGSVSAKNRHTSSVVTSQRMEKHPASTRPIVVDELLRPVGGFALCSEAASCGIRIGVIPMWPCTGIPAFTMASIAFAWWRFPSHFDLSPSLMGEATCVFDRLLGRDMEAPVRHVHHPEAVLRTSVDGLGHAHDLIKGDPGAGLDPEPVLA
jgi:hypothetical protein